jgi:hypothetical protein
VEYSGRGEGLEAYTGRLPHRNHLQITLLREIAVLTKAGMEVMALQHISHAVSQSLILMEFSEEEMKGFQEYSPQSSHLQPTRP